MVLSITKKNLLTGGNMSIELSVTIITILYIASIIGYHIRYVDLVMKTILEGYKVAFMLCYLYKVIVLLVVDYTIVWAFLHSIDTLNTMTIKMLLCAILIITSMLLFLFINKLYIKELKRKSHIWQTKYLN